MSRTLTFSRNTLCLAPQQSGRHRELRKELILRVSRLSHPLYQNMMKTATILSPRELEVLQLISVGKSNRDIAKELYLSVHTVSNHRKNMLDRSRCTNCTELVRVAIMENMI